MFKFQGVKGSKTHKEKARAAPQGKKKTDFIEKYKSHGAKDTEIYKAKALPPL